MTRATAPVATQRRPPGGNCACNVRACFAFRISIGWDGLWGLLALGLFADGSYGDGLNGVAGPVKGLFYGGSGQLWAQLTDMVVLTAFCSLMCIAFFSIIVAGTRAHGRSLVFGRFLFLARLSCPRLPGLARGSRVFADGKEGVDGSNPSEGLKNRRSP